MDGLDRYWRVGGHWGVTIVAVGKADPDENGSRDDDVLIGMALTKSAAEQIVAEHNTMLTLGHHECS